MEIWNMSTTLIENAMIFISSQFGISEALSIIAFTLISRIALLPISFKAAYNMYKNNLAMKELKPEIERLKERYKENPGELTKKMMSLYKEKGIKFMDRTSALNLGSQGVLGFGVFQTLKAMVLDSKFMWIANIAKPDMALAFLVGVLTFLSMAMMPSVAEQSAWIIFSISAVVSMFVLASFPSAIGIYWATSNLVTIGQSFLLRYIISIESSSTNKA